MAAGAGVKQMFTVPVINGTTDILQSTVTAADGTVISRHAIPYTEPKNMKLPKATVTFKVCVDADALFTRSFYCGHKHTLSHTFTHVLVTRIFVFIAHSLASSASSSAVDHGA